MSQTAQKIAQIRNHPADSAIRRALANLIGKPVGGWGEARQAIDELRGALPTRSDRDYTTDELIEAALKVDGADRYTWAPGWER